MHSHPIDTLKTEIKNSESQNKRKQTPSTFKKKETKAKFSHDLEQKTLGALKELLAQQKAEPQAPNPSPQTLQQTEETGSRIEKIDPSAQVTQLYHKLVQALTHVHQNGIQETTFFLDAKAFNSSIFEGAKITITEYNTAPKVFNVAFSADPKALSLFEAHASDLFNALQKGHFGFSVHRLDTSLLAEDEKHAHPRVERDLEKEDNHQ